jgi:hypothetical protein
VTKRDGGAAMIQMMELPARAAMIQMMELPARAAMIQMMELPASTIIQSSGMSIFESLCRTARGVLKHNNNSVFIFETGSRICELFIV